MLTSIRLRNRTHSLPKATKLNPIPWGEADLSLVYSALSFSPSVMTIALPLRYLNIIFSAACKKDQSFSVLRKWAAKSCGMSSNFGRQVVWAKQNICH